MVPNGVVSVEDNWLWGKILSTSEGDVYCGGVVHTDGNITHCVTPWTPPCDTCGLHNVTTRTRNLRVGSKSQEPNCWYMYKYIPKALFGSIVFWIVIGETLVIWNTIWDNHCLGVWIHHLEYCNPKISYLDWRYQTRCHFHSRYYLQKWAHTK